MDLDKFKKLPDSTRIWIFGFERSLSEQKKIVVEKILTPSVSNWISHGSPVEGEYLLFRDRFVILAGHCKDGISGCSIDGMMRVFKELEFSYGLKALGGEQVFFLNAENEIESASRSEFKNFAMQGKIANNQIVFDLTLRSLAELRAGKFMSRLSDSWHAKLIENAAQSNNEISEANREGI